MNFIKNPSGKNGVKDILARSHPATCGVTEREIITPKGDVAKTIRRLSSAGFYVIGTSHGQTLRKKIWFIRRGGL